MDPSLHLCFLHAKQRLWTRITIFYGSQTSPVVLCMQYSVISTRITCLYGSEPLSIAFGCTTATFGAELQVSMGPRLDLSFCGFKTAWLASEALVSMGPSPHVWFLDAKQRLLDQNNKSLRIPDKSCRFVHGNRNFSTWITSLYVSQPSSVVFACKKRILDQNFMFLWVPSLICSFCMPNS